MPRPSRDCSPVMLTKTRRNLKNKAHASMEKEKNRPIHYYRLSVGYDVLEFSIFVTRISSAPISDKRSITVAISFLRTMTLIATHPSSSRLFTVGARLPVDGQPRIA